MPGALTVAVAGMISLATAMGIGRFAFTPLLPMMLNDRVIDLSAGSWLATANYVGYLAGALLCTFQPWIWSRFPQLPRLTSAGLVRAGLVATCILTLGMAVHAPGLWPYLRFLAGVGSAIVFVFTSSWCMVQLAKANASPMGGLIFVGPGAGIASSGLLATAMVAMHWSAASGWLLFGGLAVVLTACVWNTFRGGAELGAPHRQTHENDALPRNGVEIAWLAFAYGLAGFGYIITATFLPVIAREALPPSIWLDMFWPIFGVGVMVGALVVTRIPPRYDFRHLLIGCYLIQAAGILWSVWAPSLAGFAIGSFLLGVPFTAITFFAMHEVRRLRPHAAASMIGLLTAMYGIGQIMGPPLVALILAYSLDRRQGFNLALETATATLVIGAAIYFWMGFAYPLRRAQA